MAITRTALGVQVLKAGGTGSIGLLADIAIGDWVVVCVGSDSAINSMSISNGTDSQNFSAADVTATNAGNIVSAIFSIKANFDYTTTAGSSVTIVSTAGVAWAATASKVTGLVSSSVFDRSSTGTGTGTSPSSGATATLTQADEICFGAIGTEGPNGDAAGTWSNSFNAGQRLGTTGGGDAGNVTISEGYLIVSSTSAQTAAKTSITSRDWAAAIATYKAAAVNNIPNKIYEFNQAVKRSNFY